MSGFGSNSKCRLTAQEVRANLKESGFAFFFHATDWKSINLGLYGEFAKSHDIKERLWNTSPVIGSLIKENSVPIGVNIISPVPAELWMKGAGELRRFRTTQCFEGLKLAKECGAKIVALGALMPYACKYGTLKPSHSPGLTTGHAATAATMQATLLACCNRVGKKYEDTTVAVFGANGSLGRLLVQVLLENPPKALRLIERGNSMIALGKRMSSYKTTVDISCHSYDDCNLPRFDGALLVTNQTVPFLTAEKLTRALFWIDDSHPRACSRAVEEEVVGKTLYLECYLRGPANLDVDFPFPLPSQNDCYSCMAEGYVGWKEGYSNDFLVGRLCATDVNKVSHLLKKYGFHPGPLITKSGKLTEGMS